jgi:hypothetical protein
MSRMFGSRIVLWGLFTLLLCLPLKTHAQTINAATCNNTDVQAALNSVTADGAVVNVPAGTCTWSAPVNYTQVFSTTIQGQSTCTGTGTLSPVCTDSTTVAGSEYYFTVKTAAGKALRITGFTFQVSSTFNGLLRITGPSTQLRLDHNHFYHMQAIAIIDGPLGVADHNYFDMNTTQSVFNGLRLKQNAWNGFNWGDGSWADDSHWGTSKFFFFEDNTVYNGFVDDCDTGARFVMRHNFFRDATIQGHEMAGRWNGCRAMEVYSNTFLADEAGSANIADAILIRTGTGLYWGNTVQSSGGFVYGDFIKSNNDRSNTSHGFSPANYSGCVAAAGSYSCWGYACNNAGLPNGTDCGPLNSLANSLSGFDGNTDLYGYPALEQVGRGKAAIQFPNFDFNNPSFWTTQPVWPQNQLEPLYMWLNTLGSTAQRGAIFGSNLYQQNRDWYSDSGCTTAGGAQTGGVCTGLLSQRQTNCAAGPGGNTFGVTFWATDTNTLYVCDSTNHWSTYYTPYTYPHPLVSGSGTQNVTPPTNLNAVVQ